MAVITKIALRFSEGFGSFLAQPVKRKIIVRTEIILNILTNINQTLLNNKQSNYNAEVMMDKCQVCSNKSEHTHHIEEQCDADKDGIPDTIDIDGGTGTNKPVMEAPAGPVQESGTFYSPFRQLGAVQPEQVDYDIQLNELINKQTNSNAYQYTATIKKKRRWGPGPCLAIVACSSWDRAPAPFLFLLLLFIVMRCYLVVYFLGGRGGLGIRI